MIAYNVPKIYSGMRTNGPIFPRYLKKIGRKVTVAPVRSGIGEKNSLDPACLQVVPADDTPIFQCNH